MLITISGSLCVMKMSKLSAKFMLEHKKELINGFNLSTGSIIHLAKHPEVLRKIPDKSLMLHDNGRTYFMPFKKVKPIGNFVVIEEKRKK